MKPVDPDVYRRALDRIDVMKAALRKIAAGDRLAAVIARDALELVSITDAWDNASLDANGIPVPPSLETETEYGDAVNPQGCREGSRPPIPPDVSSHPVWVPKLDNADECANCGCTWDMHAAGKAWYCPRVFEQPQSDRAVKP